MNKFLSFVAFIVFCLGTVFFIIGADKKNNYKYSEYSRSSDHNAYVGGDAYNYIINGNYFTGYMVLGSSCYIFGILCVIGQILLDGFYDLNNKVEGYGDAVIENIRQEQAKLPSLQTLIAANRNQADRQNSTGS